MGLSTSSVKNWARPAHYPGLPVVAHSCQSGWKAPEACSSSHPLALPHLALLPSSTVFHHIPNGQLVQVTLNPLHLETLWLGWL